jgi:hypothetical protein
VLGNRLVLLDTVDPKGGLDWTHRSAYTNPKTGTVAFAVKPGPTTTYRLVFPGNWQYAWAASAPAKVVVTKIPSTHPGTGWRPDHNSAAGPSRTS